MTAAAKTDIGHNSAAVGEILDERPAALFDDPSMLQALLDEGEREIAAFKADLKTDKGRKAIASFARKFVSRKTSLDEAGKEMNSSLRKKIDVVDELRRKLRDGLDKQRDKARAPLDAWEQAEEDRKEKITAIRTTIMEASRVPASATLASIAGVRAEVEGLQIDAELFGDLAAPTEHERARVLEILEDAKQRLEREEADRAELARLRAEKEEAERKVREAAAAEAARKADEERIAAAAKAAAEKAAADERRKAEEAAEAVRAAQAKALAAAEEARRLADAKAQVAIDEANRKAKAAQEALEAERRAEAAKVAAAEKAKAEQARLDAERQRNQEHRGRLMKAAKEALMEHGGIKEDAAKQIVLAIVAGSIPNVVMEF
jgi:colicin import membrane protein